jgi:hypothetical protein
LQLAKHELDEVIDLGEVDLPGFLAKFRETDWEFEADRLQFLQTTSPAIGVTNHENGAILWTSPYRPLPTDFLDEDNFRHNMAVWYVVRLDNPPSPPEITELKTGKPLADCYFESYEEHRVEELFEFFFADDYESIYTTLYSMQIAEIVSD